MSMVSEKKARKKHPEWSDALFRCVYQWIQRGVPPSQQLAELAISEQGGGPDGLFDLAVCMRSIVMSNDVTYEWLCDEGYLDPDWEKARARRLALVETRIEPAEVKAILADADRIAFLWPPKNPLSVQSASGAAPASENKQIKIDGDLSRMSANRRGRVLSEYYGEMAINPDSDVVYVFDGSVWKSVTREDMRRTMGKIYDENQTDYSVKGIDAAIDAMKIQIPVMGDVRRELIGFENGVYDLVTGEFSNHHAGNWLLHHHGIIFTPPTPGENLADHAPNFYRWVMHAAGGDERKAQRIQAALFMVLANRYDWQLFIEVTGEGGSGKSVFTSIASILAGEHNTASGSMAALDAARSRAQFVGKRLITLPDQVRYVGDGAGIKAITGGDMVEIDGKYEKQFSTIIRAVILATNNEPMTFTERKGGIARRRVIFPFNIPVADNDRDPELMAKIRAEIPVVIRYLLDLFKEQGFAKSLLIEQRDSAEAMAVKQHTDPLYGFCDHIVSLGEAVGMLIGNLNITPRAPRVYLYHAYLAYMEAYGHNRPLSLTKFGTDFPKVLSEFGAEYKKTRTKNGIRSNVDLSSSASEWLPAVPITN